MFNDEKEKRILNADFFKDILESISSTRTVSDAVSESICAQVMFFVTEVLIKAKDNTVACGQYEATEDFVRCALRDAGFPLASSDEITHRVCTFPLKVGKYANVPIELQDRHEALPENLHSGTIIHSHWLAIDGVQPAIPENPVDHVINDVPDSPPKTYKRPPQTLLFREMAKKIPKTEEVQYKQTITHPVCMEQQIFFREIMETIMGGDDRNRNEAVQCIRTDPGLTALLPRFASAVVEGVRINLIQENVAFLIYLMRIVEALLLNKFVNVEKCLHDLLPSIISVQVTRCSGEATWTLREFCGKLLLLIINRYPQPELKERIVCFLCKSLYREDAHAPMIYAIVYALNIFGPEVVENALFPHLEIILNKIGPLLTDNKQNNDNPERTAAAKRVHDLVCRCIRTFQNADTERSKTSEYRNMFNLYGCR